MPTIYLPPSIEAAQSARPAQPRLVSWYEWPVQAAGFLLPLLVFGTFAAGWVAGGVRVGIPILFLHAIVLTIFLKAFALTSPVKLLQHLVAKRGKWQNLAEWLDNAWYRPAAVVASLSVFVWTHCIVVEQAIRPFMQLFRSAPIVHPVVPALELYALAIAIAAIVGFVRTGTYNRDFRNRFQQFKRHMENLENYRRWAVWNAIRTLPAVDFDGKRSRRSEPTATALRLLGALRARGYLLADAPAGPTMGLRLIPEYELVGLRRGKFNYRADLAIVSQSHLLKLDIELDGGYHGSPVQRVKDAVRNQTFLNRGWAVIRFDNDEVSRDAMACVREIERILALLQQTPPVSLEDLAPAG